MAAQAAPPPDELQYEKKVFLVYAVNAVLDILEEDEIEEDEDTFGDAALIYNLPKHREPATRISRYAETTVLLYNDVEFKAHFRLKRETFFAMLAEIENTGIVPTPENSANVGGRQGVALDKQLLVTLWYSANQCCIRDVSDRFNVTKSSG